MNRTHLYIALLFLTAALVIARLRQAMIHYRTLLEELVSALGEERL